MAILSDFAALCLYGVVFLHNAKQSRLLFAVSSHESLPHQRTVHRLAMKAPNPCRPGESLISSPHQRVLRCFFLWEIFWKFRLWLSDVCSGTSMTTGCVVNANIVSGDPGNQHCMTILASSYPQTVHWLRVSGVWNYPVGWAYIKCSISPRKT